jgi:predicted nucleotidyltransferase
MERSEVIAKLKRNEAELKRLGVEHLYLFGSTARGEAREDSDVDLFFDHPEGSLGLFALMDVKEAAARIVRHKTDIMTRRSLHLVRVHAFQRLCDAPLPMLDQIAEELTGPADTAFEESKTQFRETPGDPSPSPMSRAIRG